MTLAETAVAVVDQPDSVAPPVAAAADDRARHAGRRILHNFIALSASRPLTWLSTIGLTILLPRYLGDVNLGKMNLAFLFADWCALLASFGISAALAKEVAQHRSTAPTTVLNAVFVRLFLALAVGAVATVVATLIPFDSLTRSLVYLLTAHMLLTVFYGVLMGALQGVQQLRIVALVDAVTKIALLGLVAAVLFGGHGAIGVAVAYLVADLIAVAWLLAAVRRRIGFAGPVTLRAGRSIVRAGLPFLVWEAALLTYARVDILILSFFAHDAVLGWYGAAYRIISIPLFIPAVVMTVMFPAFAEAADDEALFTNMARRATVMVAVTTVPMAFGLMALTGRIIELFGYPAEFTNSIMPTVLLAVALPLVAVNMIVGSILSAKDRQHQWAVAGIFAAALNIGLNLVAIPFTQSHYGNGAIGAAAVTSLTEVFLLVVGQVLLPRGLLDRATARATVKCVLVGAVMGIVVWMADGVPLLPVVVLGAVIYVAGVVLTRAVPPEELRRVRGMLSSRLRPGEADPEPAAVTGS
jgi:O-antigen/teichoic acid export membrane protein